jgi:hypothetical protein
MTLNLGLSLFSHPSSPFPKLSETTFANTNYNNNTYSLLLCTNSFTFVNFSKTLKTLRPSSSLSENQNGLVENSVSQLFLDEDLLAKVSCAKDANEALDIIADKCGRSGGGVVEVNDCCLIITVALERNNAELALSVFYAMRASFDQGIYNKVYSVYKDLLFSEMLWLLLELLNYNEFFPSYIHGQDQAE